MRKPSQLSIAALLAALFILASSAHAACSSCSGEADWSRSADEFIGWDPVGNVPADFGIDQSPPPAEGVSPAQDALVSLADWENHSGIIALESINATPAAVNSTGTTRITVVFAINDSERKETGEMQLSANAVIRDSAGAVVEKLILIRLSPNQYFSNWVADVPPGIYSLDIGASSPKGAASFKDALQIEVVR